MASMRLFILSILLACSLAEAAMGVGGGSWDWDSGSGGGGGSFSPGAILVIILILVAFYMVRANSGGGQNDFKFDPSPISNTELHPSWRMKGISGSAAAEELERKLESVFVAIQTAWSDGSMDPARAVLSDGDYHRFQLQLRMNALQVIRNTVENPALLQATLVQERTFGKYLSADFLMEGSAVDSTLRLDTGELIRGGNSIRFNEVWSFTRLANVSGEALKTMAGCPKFGASLSNSGGTHCSQCSALLNSGELDWVLAEITQPIEWRKREDGSLWEFYDRLPALSGKDAAAWLSLQELEDRASVVFIRFHADQVQDQVKAFIRVKFSGSELPETQVSNRERYLVFSKALKAGIGKAGLSSLSCPNCAAPIGTSDQARCVYCAVELASPETGWTLCGYGGAEVLDVTPVKPSVVFEAVGADRAFRALATLAKADPELAEKAGPMLRAFGLYRGNKLGELASILDTAGELPGGADVPLGDREARTFYRELHDWSFRTPMHHSIATALLNSFALQYALGESETRMAQDASLP